MKIAKKTSRKKSVAAIRSSSIVLGQGVLGLTDAESVKEYARKAKQTPSSELRELLVSTGIYTPTGRLSKHFKSDK